jgi:MFS family permease
MAGQATPKGAWTITTLLFLYMLVNFADKAVVGLAAVPIMKDLNLTPKEFGLLGSSFFLLFPVSAIFVGFIANRVQARYVIMALAASWALVQFPMVGTVGLSTLLVCRILLGAGEGPAFAIALHAVYKWFPDEKRTLPTAVVSQGSAFGVIVALPALNWIIVHYSWHWAFGALGIVGLLWVAAWLALGKEGVLTDAARPGSDGNIRERQPYSRLLLAPTFIGCCLACFGAYWSLSLGLTWFTPFIIKGLGYSQQDAGWLSTLPWVMGAIVVLSTGWFSQKLMSSGFSSRVARSLLGCAPLVAGGFIILAVPYMDNNAGKITLLVLGGGLTGAVYVVCPPIISEFTPLSQRAAMIAIFGAIFTFAGIVAPAVNGSVIEGAATALEGYEKGYMITALIQICCGSAAMLLLWLRWETARQAQLHEQETGAAVIGHAKPSRVMDIVNK